ncbi:retrovirus-related pol polyprotein from transposon TNT 1-94 [Tanacetum coccineum]
MDKGVADTVKDHKRKHDDDEDDDDEDPPARPNQGSKTGKSASTKELVEEPITEVDMDDVGDDVAYNDNQQQDASKPKTTKTLNPDWFNQPQRHPTSDAKWNKHQDPLTFNDLMATPIDFSNYVLNELKIENLTQNILLGPAFNLLKGTCSRSIELEYNFQECFNALTDKLDWNNLEGEHYPFDLSKPLPLQGPLGHQTIAADYFFNNDLEYLKTSDPEAILGVKSVSVKKLHRYGHLEEIVVKRYDQQLYKFKEGDFVDLHMNDIEDMLLLAMDVKSAFLNGKISKEVYVQQPPGFESIEFPYHVCMLDKALYRLKQAPRAWYQANPTESHLVAIKRISRYLKGTPNLGLWYPKGSGFDLKAYFDSDYVGCNLDRKSTSGGCQILGGKLVCWSAKKQSTVAMSSAKAEYVPIFCDNTSAIAISNNPVLHSRTTHIDIRYHFIRDHILKGDIELHFVPTDLQLADIFTKPLAEPSFTRLLSELAEADTAMKSITFTLSHFDKPLSFDLDVFSTVIGIECCEDFVSIPPKENVKADLATLGLTNENNTSLSSSDLINSSSVKIKPHQVFSPEEIVATADTTKSLEAFESVEDQVNQPQTVDAEKSMPDDDLVSLSGFEAEDTDEEGSQSNHVESVMTP